MKPPESPTPPARIPFVALVVVMCAGLAIGMRLFHDNHALKAELATLRSVPNQSAAGSQNESASLAAEIERESVLLSAAETRAIEIGKSLPALSNEEWRSLGHVEELGWQAGDLLDSMSEIAERRKSGEKISREEDARVFQEMTAGLARLAVIGDMEDSPDEIARLHATTLRARLKLDAATADRVRHQIEREFIHLRDQKLTRSNLLEEEHDEWFERRSGALDAAAIRVEALIPVSQREQFVVGQSLHLGTGRRAIINEISPGRLAMRVSYDLPGLE